MAPTSKVGPKFVADGLSKKFFESPSATNFGPTFSWSCPKVEAISAISGSKMATLRVSGGEFPHTSNSRKSVRVFQDLAPQRYPENYSQVVLGHTKCGAVNAACSGQQFGGHLPSLVQWIAYCSNLVLFPLFGGGRGNFVDADLESGHFLPLKVPRRDPDLGPHHLKKIDPKFSQKGQSEMRKKIGEKSWERIWTCFESGIFTRK